MKTWDLLRKELSIYDIELRDDGTCFCVLDGKRRHFTIDKKIQVIKEELKDNCLLFKDILKEISEILSLNNTQIKLAIDIKISKLFAKSIEDMLKLASFLKYESVFFSNILNESKVISFLEIAITKDIYDFPYSSICSIPDYKIALDWIVRRNNILIYLIRLLKFSKTEEVKTESTTVKMARGISGPWANLDLPMQERVWEWDDIEEEMRGRDRDIRKQRRYRQGFENYNNSPSVGEGYFWREIRNEPFSWYDRASEDPYPHRSVLTNY